MTLSFIIPGMNDTGDREMRTFKPRVASLYLMLYKNIYTIKQIAYVCTVMFVCVYLYVGRNVFICVDMCISACCDLIVYTCMCLYFVCLPHASDDKCVEKT